MNTYELYHAGIKGMKWGYTKDPNYKPVGEPAKGEQKNRPRARQKNVTGKGQPVYKRGSGIGSTTSQRGDVNRSRSIKDEGLTYSKYTHSNRSANGVVGASPSFLAAREYKTRYNRWKDTRSGDAATKVGESYAKMKSWQTSVADLDFKQRQRNTGRYAFQTGDKKTKEMVDAAIKSLKDGTNKYDSKFKNFVNKAKKRVSDLFSKWFGGSGKITVESHLTTVGPTIFGEEYDANTGRRKR